MQMLGWENKRSRFSKTRSGYSVVRYYRREILFPLEFLSIWVPSREIPNTNRALWAVGEKKKNIAKPKVRRPSENSLLYFPYPIFWEQIASYGLIECWAALATSQCRQWKFLIFYWSRLADGNTPYPWMQTLLVCGLPFDGYDPALSTVNHRYNETSSIHNLCGCAGFHAILPFTYLSLFAYLRFIYFMTVFDYLRLRYINFHFSIKLPFTTH